MTPAAAAELLAALRPRAVRLEIAAGDAVFRVNSPAHSVYFIEAGAVHLTRFGRAGEEVAIHAANAGEFFAEASLHSERYHCDAIAALPSTLLQISAPGLRELLRRDPDFAQAWIALLSRQLRAARMRIERLSLKGAAERVRHLLLTEGRGPHCEVALEGSLKDLAHDLGLSHETLYRTLAAMQRKGQIEREKTLLRLVRSP